MATERLTIINAVKTLLENPTFGLALFSVQKTVEVIAIKDEDFPNFPLAHIVDKDEIILQYCPGRRIEARIQPWVRLFYTTATYDELDEINSKIKIAFASNNWFPLGPTPKYTRIKAIRTIKEPNHNFVELRVELEIAYSYIDGTP